MGTVDMERHVTLDMRKEFAMITIVIFMTVKKDTQGLVVGSKNMGGVNLQHFANLSIYENQKL